MLARMAISGGAPREILDDVQSAAGLPTKQLGTRAPYKHKLPVGVSHRQCPLRDSRL